MIPSNGNIRKRLEGFLNDLRVSPDWGGIWKEYINERITNRELERAICQLKKIRLSVLESQVLEDVIMKQLFQEFGMTQR